MIIRAIYFGISQDRRVLNDENDLCIIYKLIIWNAGWDRLEPTMIGVTRPAQPPFKAMYIIIFLVQFLLLSPSCRAASGNNFYNGTFLKATEG